MPTFDEAGLKDYESTTWVSFFVPKDTPKDIADKLTAAVNAALADPTVLARFDKGGIVKPAAPAPAFLEKYLKDEIDKWGDILRTTKDYGLGPSAVFQREPNHEHQEDRVPGRAGGEFAPRHPARPIRDSEAIPCATFEDAFAAVTGGERRPRP